MWEEKIQKKKKFLKALVVSFAVLPFFTGLVACKKMVGMMRHLHHHHRRWLWVPMAIARVLCGFFCAFNGREFSVRRRRFSGVFDMIASPSATGFNLANPKAIIYYRGPFQLIGTMTVSAASDFRYCGVVPGQYMIRPISNGWISMGAMGTGGRIVGESPAGRFTAVIGGGVVTNGTSSMGVVRGDPGNRLYMTLRFESVNGQPCFYGYYSMGISFFLSCSSVFLMTGERKFRLIKWNEKRNTSPLG